MISLRKRKTRYCVCITTNTKITVILFI